MSELTPARSQSSCLNVRPDPGTCVLMSDLTPARDPGTGRHVTPARVTPARVSVFSIHSGQTVQNDVGFADHARAHAEKHDD